MTKYTHYPNDINDQAGYLRAITERLEWNNELMVELIQAVNSRPISSRNICCVCGKELAINTICSCRWSG